MINHIQLGRRFRDLSKVDLEKAELIDPEILDWLGGGELSQYDGWPELLRYPRVVLLAEAGSGKTAEMREQARCLCAQGQLGLFLDLASLGRGAFVSLMSMREQEQLAIWEANSNAVA